MTQVTTAAAGKDAANCRLAPQCKRLWTLKALSPKLFLVPDDVVVDDDDVVVVVVVVPVHVPSTLSKTEPASVSCCCKLFSTVSFHICLTLTG